MSSLLILDEIHVVSTYDDSSFTKEDHSRRIHPNDPTRVAIVPAETDRGTKFEPFHVESRDLCINTLPPTPLLEYPKARCSTPSALNHKVHVTVEVSAYPPAPSSL
jgi:hypothetical protein